MTHHLLYPSLIGGGPVLNKVLEISCLPSNHHLTKNMTNEAAFIVFCLLFVSYPLFCALSNDNTYPLLIRLVLGCYCHEVEEKIFTITRSHENLFIYYHHGSPT